MAFRLYVLAVPYFSLSSSRGEALEDIFAEYFCRLLAEAGHFCGSHAITDGDNSIKSGILLVKSGFRGWRNIIL